MPPPFDLPDDSTMSIQNGPDQRRVRYRRQPDGTMLADIGPDGRPGVTWDQSQTTRPIPGQQLPVPGQPVNFGGQAQQGRLPYLSLDQVMGMVPYHQTPDSNPLSPYYTGVRTSYRDPGLTAAALNFYNQQQSLQQSTDDTSLRRALGFGELNVRQQQTDINRQLAGERSDPKSGQMQHALDFLKQNPNATPAQLTAAMGKFNQAMQVVRPDWSNGAPQQTGAPNLSNPAGAAPANKQAVAPNAVSVEQERQGRLGPEVYSWLNQPADDATRPKLAADAMSNIYRHDQQNPGYMQKLGPEVYSLLKQNYGEPALQSFLNPGGAHAIGQSLSNIFGSGDLSDTEKARGAWRHYLGNTAPLPWWVNMAKKINPDLDQIGDESGGAPPIPGSPGAMRKR